MIVPGFMVLHGNQMEVLRDVLVQWIRQHPLQPLEPEVILVQSQGMAQWLKHALAMDDGIGIAAGVEVSLPARFIWRSYRAVLAGQAIAERSPLDKDSLAWRLFQRLPTLLQQASFAPLKHYLDLDDDARRLFQLCQHIADVFDQYQMYRADWLVDWAQGQDRLGDLPRELSPSQQQTLAWQAQLWRTLLNDIGIQAMASSRAGIHPRVIKALEQADQRPAGLPRRIVVFGISSLPAQTLEALSAMARFSQVLLCVHNPCQYYWGDIVADKDLLRHRTPRHKKRDGMPDQISEAYLHQHAHPLLAAWGKQGRDYIALLETHDHPSAYAHYFDQLQCRIDLFEDPDTTTLLGQLQSDILHLRPIQESRDCWQNHDVSNDQSVAFHVAHSAQREVEILHDQLLDRLQQDPELQPRDMIVMVPDIDHYAPRIQAVFGQYDRHDPRYLPFSVADQGQRGREPLLIALEMLLQLPELRFTLTQILSLLDVPALRNRFGIHADDVPLLERWLGEAGIRWGFDHHQRLTLGLSAHTDRNTWDFGLRRMLLGYAMGGSAVFAGHQPYDEVAGLEAAILGPFFELYEALEQARTQLSACYRPTEWVVQFNQLLVDFFLPAEPGEQLLLQSLQQAAEQWLQACTDADFDLPVELAISREAWLQELEMRQHGHGFMAGAITFCTLMPMRAIPFKVVCLLGMNDGDYPRSVSTPDFDLMDHDYRPGDRSRREDDRYLLLEAVLAARQALLISWVGRSQQDNSVLPPSVLIAQLRDYLEQVYGSSPPDSTVLDHLTTHHALQPFSAAYFDGQSPRRFTYAHEWQSIHQQDAPAPEQATPLHAPLPALNATLEIDDLRRFLRQPVVVYYERQLKVNLAPASLTPVDDEPFELDGLQTFQLRATLLEAAHEAGAEQAADAIKQALCRQRLSGVLPLPPFDQLYLQGLQDDLHQQLQAYFELLEGMQQVDTPLMLSAGHESISLHDTLPTYWQDSSGAPHAIRLFVGRLGSRSDWRWHRILPFWLEHVFYHCVGCPVTTHVVGQDRTLVIGPFEASKDASQQVQDWLALWQLGMGQPLPVEFDAATTWLDKRFTDRKQKKDEQGHRALREARKVYEDTQVKRPSALDKAPVFKRDFPDFDRLLAARAEGQDFFTLAESLYGRLIQHRTLHAPVRSASTRRQRASS